jgi:hypothetical protein
MWLESVDGDDLLLGAHLQLEKLGLPVEYLVRTGIRGCQRRPSAAAANIHKLRHS